MKTSIEEVNEAAGTLYLKAQAYATQCTPPQDGFYVASAALVAVADPGSSESACEVQKNEIAVEAVDANSYCKILSLLGMEEEGDPVQRIIELIEIEANFEMLTAPLPAKSDVDGTKAI